MTAPSSAVPPGGGSNSSDQPTQPYRPDDDPSVLARLLDDYLAELQAGRHPDRARLVAAHPELAAELEACLAGLDFIHRTGQPASAPSRLGDFRIVREVGRGGMGVVYEAEQLSLRRRVALKVLKIAVGADTDAVDRFRREAETVAVLHHTNIVPIFAVGSEDGVHYFAMQFIEGKSLAEVIGRATTGVEMDAASPQAAAGWCLEAAEALAHAHRRGVIHRDVKPSNLLLDQEGRIWLSDFGLARRASEATLTVTGALMGTPRYMSPEQASSAKHPIDHRTDVYSLGATLYELAAGRPAFDAETPHAILTKIVGTEPVAPRKLKPGLPRDLETIILRCLAKEPRERYQSAQDLADDLRRFVSGDPIRARRPSLFERTRRWVRKRRQSVAVSTGAAVLAALLAVAAVVGWNHHHEAQKGRLTFGTTGPHFKAELLDANDVPTGVSFTVPNEDPVRVEPGEYNLQLSRDGVLSETVRMSVEPAADQKFQIDLTGRELWEQVAIPRIDVKHEGFAFIESRGHVDLLTTATQRGMMMLRPKNDRWMLPDGIVWNVSWQGWHPNRGDDHPGARGFGYTEPMLEILNSRRYLVTPAPQLTKKDHVADPVWAGLTGLLAVNGDDGHVLWHHPWRTEPASAEKSEAKPAANRDDSVYADRTGRPFELDVNGDGTPDFIAFAEAQHREKRKNADGTETNTASLRRWIEAVDGRDGKEIWRRPFRRGWNPELVTSESLPIEFVKGKPGQMVVAIDGSQVLFVDPKTGKDLWPPAELGDDAPTQLRHFDVDADGTLDSLLWIAGTTLHALQLADGKSPPSFPKKLDFRPVGDFTLVSGPQPSILLLKENATAQLELRRYGWGDDKPIWTRPIRAAWPPKEKKNHWDALPYRKPVWPLVVDRWHNDPHRDVIVPDRFSRTKPEPEPDSDTIHLDFDDKSQWWAGLSVLDADTGALRWQRQLPAETNGGDYLQLNRFTAGDDIDGDGFREVYVASFGSGHRDAEGEGDTTHRFLYVTCLAGSDGRTLWWWHQRFRDDSSAFIEPPQWWQNGPDGHPLLMVSYNADSSHNGSKSPSTTFFLQASTGKVEHVLAGVGEPKLADISGDGVLDLYSVVEPSLQSTQFRSDVQPQLFTMQGTLPVAWRRLGKWQPTIDINGDGVSDVLWSHLYDQRLDAADGRTGQPLWKSRNAPNDSASLTPLPKWDLDDDGVPDLIGRSPMGRNAVSLRTGERLWKFPKGIEPDAELKGDAVGISYGGRLASHPAIIRPWGDDRTAVVYEFQLTFGPTNLKQRDEQTTQRWIAAVEGRSGKLLWKTPLGEKDLKKYEVVCTMLPADLDGDGTDDVVVLSAGEPHWLVRGVRGRDGTVLWTRELAQTTGPYHTQIDEHPVLLVDDAVPKSPRIFVVERDSPVLSVEKQAEGEDPIVKFGTSAHQILMLSPKDGAVHRLWRGPETSPITLTQHMIPWSARGVFAKFDASGRSLCVNLVRPWNNKSYGYEVWNDQVVIGPDDAKRSERSSEGMVAWSSTLVMPSMEAADLDGDGFDELVWGERPLKESGTLYAARGGFDRDRPLWKINYAHDRLNEIIPRGPGRDPLVLLSGSNSNRYAVSGRTGETVWKSWPGTLLAATSPDEPLRFLNTREDLTTCYVGGQATPSERLPEAAVRFQPPPDPRLSMSLPWNDPTEVWVTIKASLYSLALLIVPLFFLWRSLARRSWRWGLAFALSAGTIAFAYWQKWLPGSVTSFGELFAFLAAVQMLEKVLAPLSWVGLKLDLATMKAMIGLPVLGIPLALLLLWRQWRWRGVAALLVFNVVVSAVVAVILLKVSTSQFDPHQYHVWTNWALIYAYGAYWTGMIALALWLSVEGASAARAIWRRFRRVATRSVAKA